MASQSDHHPIQIIRQSETRKFILDETALRSLLDQKDVHDCNLSIVSICGAFRKGKSFILSFFLRYLEAMYADVENPNWLGDVNVVRGFKWRGGIKRETDGMWVWSKIFTKTLQSGEKIGIMLMDTQGTFDNQSTVHDNLTVFSLATMISSVQIYNLSGQIQEDNLQSLQLFTNYGRMVLECSGSHSTPFQKLVFLIRDWPNACDFALGFTGGQQYLLDYMQSTKAQESNDIRKDIISCFESMDCCLLPHPGMKVVTSQQFDGSLDEIEPSFVHQTKDFVETILNKNSITSKTINGQKISARRMFGFVKSYCDAFSGENLPEAKTILEATAEAIHLMAKDDALEFYNRMMVKFSAGETYYDLAVMVAKNNDGRAAAMLTVSI